MKKIIITSIVIFNSIFSYSQDYIIVDTGVDEFYSNNSLIVEPVIGNMYFGQDANYSGNQPSYTDNGNGTITDNVTGLMWEKDMGVKISYQDAFIKADSLLSGGYNDWRVPTIKELYSLILFTGRVMGETPFERFIDTNYFIQPLGDTSIGERLIDAQTWSSTQYRGLTMNGDTTVFGVNFLDGRIKGYPKYIPPIGNILHEMYFRMVRGNINYGINNFLNNGNGTISDNATGLMWQQSDNGLFYDWEEALEYSENLTLASYDDWRLPNAKELQSLVDYTRCPQITSSPAIDTLFACTEIYDPNGFPGQYPYYWTGTSHLDGLNPYSSAVYIAFGEAMGKMNNILLDVHGAGAQRSDPKSGNPGDFPDFFGPQGDVRYVYNAVRCVRDIDSFTTEIYNSDNIFRLNLFPNPVNDHLTICFETECDIFNVKVMTITGQTLIDNIYNNETSVNLDLSGFYPGMYIIRVEVDNVIFVKKIIRN